MRKNGLLLPFGVWLVIFILLPLALVFYYGVTVDWLLGREGSKEKTTSAQYAEARGYAMGLRLAADALVDMSERLHDKADRTEPRI